MRRRIVRSAASIGGAVLVLVATSGTGLALLGQAPAGVIVSGSPSNFESGDGNMTVDYSNNAANDTDWNCFKGATANCKATSGATFITADASGEIEWVNGQKFDTLCPLTNLGNNPPKDEFVNIAQFNETDASLNEFFYGATIRSTNNGNASGDIEFDHNKGATPTSMPCRVAGDILMAYDFLNGGTSLNFHLVTWIDSSNPNAGGNLGTCLVKTDTLPCWGGNVITPDSSTSNGQSNQLPISAANNLISNAALPVNQFSEFGINLSKALGISGQCLSFPQQTWESRSSGSSFTSNPQDLEINQQQIQNCGEVVVIKHTDPRGVNQNFSYTSTIAGTSTQVSCTQGTAASFTLNDGTTLPAGTNTQDCTNVPAGSSTVTEGNEPSGFTFESLTCTAKSGASVTTSGETASIAMVGGGFVTCTYVNQQNSATLATNVSTAGPVFPGVTVHDTATVTGSPATAGTPSGTVTFSLCGPIATGSCDGTTNVGNSIGTGTLGGTTNVASATSPDVNTSASPLIPGRYCFRATWPGDNNYPGTLTEFGGATGTNECFTVAQIPTTTTTTPSIGSGATTTFGSSVTDHAVVQATKSGDGTPTGTVTFFICDPTQTTGGACPTGGTQVGSPVTTQDASPATTPPSSFADSTAVTVNMTGTWCFRAVYTPGGANGSNYTGSSDATSGECFTVNDTTSSTSAQTWLPNDTATVTSANGAPLNGTLSVQLYTGGDCGVTSGSAVGGQLYQKTLNNATSPASLTTSNTTYAVSTSTSVSWLVTFTSTDPNVASSSHCESTSLTITN